MKLTWNKYTGMTGYEIYRSTSKNGTYKKAKTITSDINSVTITGLKTGTNHYYKVRAYTKISTDTKLYSGFTSVKSVTVK